MKNQLLVLASLYMLMTNSSFAMGKKLTAPQPPIQTPVSCHTESAGVSVRASKGAMQVDFCAYGARDIETGKRCLPTFKDITFDNYSLALDTNHTSHCETNVARAYTLNIPGSPVSEHSFSTEDEFGIQHSGIVHIAKIELLNFPKQVSLGSSLLINFNAEAVLAEYEEEKSYILATEGSPVTILGFALDSSGIIPSANIRRVRPEGGLEALSLCRHISKYVDGYGYSSIYFDGVVFNVNP